MTREDRIKLAIEKGFTYDEVSGKIYGIHGKEITGMNSGYIKMYMYLDKNRYILYAHQFAYYIKYNKIVDYIDHINGIKDDNRICNLREVTNQQNQHNRTKAKGYISNRNKYVAQITINSKSIHLGRYNTEQEARQAYLDAKKIYHII